MRRHHRNEHAVTLIELLFLLAMLVAGVLCASWAGRQFGWLGAVPAFALGFVAIPAIGASASWIDRRFRPPFPPCKRGRCRGWEYESVRVIEIRRLDPSNNSRECIWRCKCGDEFIETEGHLRFIGADNVWHSFMLRTGNRSWRPDEAPSIPASVAQVVWEKEAVLR